MNRQSNFLRNLRIEGDPAWSQSLLSQEECIPLANEKV